MNKPNYTRIEDIRNQLGLRKNEMAARLIVSPRQYSSWGNENASDVPYWRVNIAEDLLNRDVPGPIELKILRSNYEIYRMSILNHFCLEVDRLSEEFGLYDCSVDQIKVLKEKIIEILQRRFEFSFIFAILHKMCPYYEQNTDMNDSFEDVYDINKNFIHEVINTCLDAEDNKRNLTFYDLENECGCKDKRIEILWILEYISLQPNRFPERFFKNLEKNSPSETSNIAKWEFNPFDIKIGNSSTV